jgi:hypothetical protein
VARLMVRRVCPQLRKCRVCPGTYAWCQQRSLAYLRHRGRARPIVSKRGESGAGLPLDLNRARDWGPLQESAFGCIAGESYWCEERIIAAALDQAALNQANERGAGARIEFSRDGHAGLPDNRVGLTARGVDYGSTADHPAPGA